MDSWCGVDKQVQYGGHGRPLVLWCDLAGGSGLCVWLIWPIGVLGAHMGGTHSGIMNLTHSGWDKMDDISQMTFKYIFLNKNV